MPNETVTITKDSWQRLMRFCGAYITHWGPGAMDVQLDHGLDGGGVTDEQWATAKALTAEDIAQIDAARQEESTNAETAALQTSDIKQGGQNGAICQAAIARQEDPTDAND